MCVCEGEGEGEGEDEGEGEGDRRECPTGRRFASFPAAAFLEPTEWSECLCALRV